MTIPVNIQMQANGSTVLAAADKNSIPYFPTDCPERSVILPARFMNLFIKFPEVSYIPGKISFNI